MTVTTSASVVTVLGNGSATSFAYNFIIPGANSSDQTNVVVLYTDVSGVVTSLINSDYTITGINNPTGGTVNFTLASNTPIPSGASITIMRNVPYTQPDTIANQSNFYPQAVEDALDNLAMEIQQLRQQLVVWRGTWVSAVNYQVGNFVIDGVNGNNTSNVYFCVIANTSTVWATDLAAGDWALAIVG